MIAFGRKLVYETLDGSCLLHSAKLGTVCCVGWIINPNEIFLEPFGEWPSSLRKWATKNLGAINRVPTRSILPLMVIQWLVFVSGSSSDSRFLLRWPRLGWLGSQQLISLVELMTVLVFLFRDSSAASNNYVRLANWPPRLLGWKLRRNSVFLACFGTDTGWVLFLEDYCLVSASAWATLLSTGFRGAGAGSFFVSASLQLRLRGLSMLQRARGQR